MTRLQRKPQGPTTSGFVNGFTFRSICSRPMLVPFTSMVPQNEGFQNPRYVKFEQGFSRKVKSSRIHECIVVVDHEAFLVSAYWEGGAGPNRAVDAACPGLEWRGEIAVVQTGHLVTFRKRVQRLSVANRAVSKFISEYKYATAVGDPLPTNLKTTL